MSQANSSAREGTTPTDRELEVLRVWVETGSARRAASRLGITVSGVEAMLANVRARAGVRHSWEAVHVYLHEVA